VGDRDDTEQSSLVYNNGTEEKMRFGETMRFYATLSVVALLAFALGWTSNGYRIYSGMFEYTISKSVSSANDLLQGLKK
jgi:hypothetical protein